MTRDRLRDIVFESEDRAGTIFDVTLIVAIAISVLVVMLDSVESISQKFGSILFAIEVILTVAFTIEYVLRLWLCNKPLAYARSFMGVVDLLAILPTYISFFIAGHHYLATVRALRLLRIFRVLKLANYLNEASTLACVLTASKRKIAVFLLGIGVLTIIFGSLMYVVEGPENGFANIFEACYWTVVTMTTLGYGDLTPVTAAGKFVTTMIALAGFAIIVVPGSIITKEMINQSLHVSTEACPDCGRDGHTPDAVFCKFCAAEL